MNFSLLDSAGLRTGWCAALAAGLAAAALLAGCTQDDADKVSGTQAQQQLSYGWAQLYETADGLSGIDKLLYVKVESDAVDRFISGMADDLAGLADDIEAVTAGVPWIDLSDTGLPQVERDKRGAAQFDRALGLAPLVGRTGTDFERTLLLTLSGGLNQSRFLTTVMLDMDEDPERRKVLERANAMFDRLYDADVDLLNARYFCSSAKLDQPVTDDAASRDFDGDEGGDSDNVRPDAEQGAPTVDGPTQAQQNAEDAAEQERRAEAGGPRAKGQP